MRAVLDRPHRSNFVSVSTAVNRVAKLAASRRRGGGLKGEEEPKYLGVLLKVRVSCEASGGELTDSACCSVLAVQPHWYLPSLLTAVQRSSKQLTTRKSVSRRCSSVE